MGTSSKTPSAGARVAHLSIDDADGGAKAGVVEEYIGDDEGGLVIIKGEDGSSEGYDRREVVPLVGIAALDKGPVLLYPRHLWAMLKRPAGAASVVAALIIAVAIVALSDPLSTEDVAIIGIGLLVVSSCLFFLGHRKRARQDPTQ